MSFQNNQQHSEKEVTTMKSSSKFKNRLRQVLRGLSCVALAASMATSASAGLEIFMDYDAGNIAHIGDADLLQSSPHPKGHRSK